MTNESQRPVEQALREYGRRRAEQAAPAALHPATRAMLQGEVSSVLARPLSASSEEAARNFARPFGSTPMSPGWLARFWPRLAFAGTIAAAFALVVTVIRNQSETAATRSNLADSPAAPLVQEPAALVRQPMPTAPVDAIKLADDRQAVAERKPSGELQKRSLAENSESRAENLAVLRDAVPRSAGGGGMAANRAGDAVTKSKAEALRQEAAAPRELAASSPKAAAAPAATESFDARGPVAGTALKSISPNSSTNATVAPAAVPPVSTLALGLAPAAPMKPALTTSVVSGKADLVADLPGLLQQFSQEPVQRAYRRNFNSPPLPNVMSTFQLARNGDRVVITDADGSTYDGTVIAAAVNNKDSAPPAQNEELKKQLAEQLGEKARQPADTSGSHADFNAFYFRAAGTNRTLNRRVVFTGNYIATDDADGKEASENKARKKAVVEDEAVRLRFTTAAAKAGQAADTLLKRSTLAPQGAAQADQKAQAQVRFQFRSNALPSGRVQGTAVIGTDRLEINAVPKK